MACLCNARLMRAKIRFSQLFLYARGIYGLGMKCAAAAARRETFDDACCSLSAFCEMSGKAKHNRLIKPASQLCCLSLFLFLRVGCLIRFAFKVQKMERQICFYHEPTKQGRKFAFHSWRWHVFSLKKMECLNTA